jgi:hypothetical protein
MTVAAGEVVVKQFTVQTPSTGEATDADSLPTGKLVRNGADTAETVVIANVETGVYTATVTIPSGYAVGDDVEIRIQAVMATVTGKGIIWSDRVDVTIDSRATAATVWSYTERRLTDPAASAGDTSNAGDITRYTATRWTIELTGLGDISGRSANGLYFTVQKKKGAEDRRALIQIQEGVGLLYTGGREAQTAANASLTVDDEVAGDVTIVVKEDENQYYSEGDYYYDVKMLTAAAGPSVKTNPNSRFFVRDISTQTIA